MTTIKKRKKTKKIGQIIQQKREELSLKPNTREHFLEDRINLNLVSENSISLKTLVNIENGLNIPNLQTLIILSTMLEVDTIDLIREIIPFVPPRN